MGVFLHLALQAHGPLGAIMKLHKAQPLRITIRFWASRSASELSRWGLPEFPAMASCPTTYRQYASLVHALLEARCRAGLDEEIARHQSQVPYRLFQPGLSTCLAQLSAAHVPWQLAIAVRGWCRLRCGVQLLRAQGGRRSEAKSQSCIFCSGS